MLKNRVQNVARREFDQKLDRLEASINELRVLYEQYFVDIIPLPAAKYQKDIKKTIRHLLKAPFKNSANRFRLRQVIQKYQTYATYWERVCKQKEEGTYVKDKFKMCMRERFAEEDKLAATKKGAAEKQIRQLFTCYENALAKVGQNSKNVDYEAFKKTLIDKAKQLKAQHGATKLQYKIVMRDGKVIIKASAGAATAKKAGAK
ncbi:MAG: hypothetical protein IT291_09835 [Deltaproteobacteria bacterium]|nr:hypothetical protein [Deltaproteobacteria bacterium]